MIIHFVLLTAFLPFAATFLIMDLLFFLSFLGRDCFLGGLGLDLDFLVADFLEVLPYSYC